MWVSARCAVETPKADERRAVSRIARATRAFKRCEHEAQSAGAESPDASERCMAMHACMQRNVERGARTIALHTAHDAHDAIRMLCIRACMHACASARPPGRLCMLAFSSTSPRVYLCACPSPSPVLTTNACVFLSACPLSRDRLRSLRDGPSNRIQAVGAPWIRFDRL